MSVQRLTRGLSICLVALIAVGGLFACNLINREVACNRDRDCPVDAGMPFCDAWVNVDAGDVVGTCTNDDEYFGDFFFPPDPDGGTVPPQPGEAQ